MSPPDDGSFQQRYYSAPDGLKLAARIYGSEHDGPLPVVCLPGLTRNSRDFHALALHLSKTAPTPRTVVAFDYRGRGRSEHDRNWRNYDVMVEAGDVLAGMSAFGISEAAFIGTSRGGLILFALAAMRPAALKAVVLNDIGPVIEGAGLAQIRAYLERMPRPKTMADAVDIQKAANLAAFPALGEQDWQRMTRAFYREEKTGPVPDFDPALIKTVKGIDLNAPQPVFWPQFTGLTTMPLLAIRGANSKLLAEETLREMARRHPRMESITVEGQGHAPLLETGILPARIATFIDRSERHRS